MFGIKQRLNWEKKSVIDGGKSVLKIFVYRERELKCLKNLVTHTHTYRNVTV